MSRAVACARVDYHGCMTTPDTSKGFPKWVLFLMLLVSAAILYGVIDWIADA